MGTTHVYFSVPVMAACVSNVQTVEQACSSSSFLLNHLLLLEFFYYYFQSLSSLVKSTENDNGVTFRSGADEAMDISVSGFGAESAIDRVMQMVSLCLQIKCLFFAVLL